MKLRLPFSHRLRAKVGDTPRGIDIGFAPILRQAQGKRGPDLAVSWDDAAPKVHTLTPRPVQCIIQSSNQLIDRRAVWAV